MTSAKLELQASYELQNLFQAEQLIPNIGYSMNWTLYTAFVYPTYMTWVDYAIS